MLKENNQEATGDIITGRIFIGKQSLFFGMMPPGLTNHPSGILKVNSDMETQRIADKYSFLNLLRAPLPA